MTHFALSADASPVVDMSELRQRGSAAKPQGAADATKEDAAPRQWEGPELAGFDEDGDASDAGADDAAGSDDSDAEDPPYPVSAEDDRLVLIAVLVFFGAILLAAALPASGKAVSLAGMGLFLSGAAILIFSSGARGALPLGVGVGVACVSLGLLFGGLLQETTRYLASNALAAARRQLGR